MTHDEVIREITRRAWSFGVSVLLSPGSRVDAGDGIMCGGYFDVAPEVPVLAVATGGPPELWLGTLLHEYAHVTQWAENTTVWKDDRFADWAAWLNGKRVANIKDKIAITRELEADCERRTVRMIREMDAPIDLEHHCRGANAYIHFYNYMAVHRKWYGEGKQPYGLPAVMAAANPTLDDDYSKTPKRLWDAMAACI